MAIGKTVDILTAMRPDGLRQWSSQVCAEAAAQGNHSENVGLDVLACLNLLARGRSSRPPC
jgi:hypothetical protein